MSSDVTTGPAAPTSVTAGSITVSSAQLTWVDNASDETGYEVQRCTGSSCTSFAAISGSPFASGATSATDSSLASGTTYRFRVRAVRASVVGDWQTSANVTTSVAAASCASPTTRVIDFGQKGTLTVTGRGTWSDLKVAPGTNYPAIAYYDGSATGGGAQLKLAYWDGSAWQIENVAGDRITAAGSATFVRLAFLSSGVPMVFWSTGSTTVKGAMRSAALTATGTWTTAVLDTFTGGATRALDVSVSAADHVGVAYVTNTAAGRVRFVYCGSPCTSISGFSTNVMAATDFVDNSNSAAGSTGIGVGWCKQSSSVFYPAVAYSGNAGATIRYATCQNATLSNCKLMANWSNQAVVTSTGSLAHLQLDSATVGDTPKVLARVNATSLSVYQMGSACNAGLSAFTGGATIGGANSGTAWARLLKDTTGRFHIFANEGTTSVGYFNSTTTSGTGPWNPIGSLETLTLPAAGAGGGGADIASSTGQAFASYGGSTTPFNLIMGVVSDFTFPSNSVGSAFYSLLPDLTGNINLTTATGQTRNVSVALASEGKPGVAYVDHSNGAIAGARLKFALRAGLTATSTWTAYTLPNVGSPIAPALAFDANDRPWISYYDGNNFRYYLATNTASDGSGNWRTYQFPLGAKVATGSFPATDDTAVAMHYSGGVARPVMIILNSTAAGGTGVRAARFDPSTGVFSSVTTVDSLGASWATRLTSDFDRNGNIVIAYYDLTTTTVKYNHSSNGLNWLASSPLISTATTGREGLSIRLNPSTTRPAVSYYDRANNRVHYTSCSTAIGSCSSALNWSISQVEGSAGVSGLPTTGQELALSTSLSFSASGVPYVAYMTGIAATTPSLALATVSGATFASTALVTSPSAGPTGANAFNFALTGFNVSSVRNDLGHWIGAYVGPNNWLYATSCGD